LAVSNAANWWELKRKQLSSAIRVSRNNLPIDPLLYALNHDFPE
jgi:hypothetical protein